MNADLELTAWRHEWTAETEPLPALKRRVRAQNRRMRAGAVAGAVCLAAGTALGWGRPFDSWWGGFAVGLWAASALGLGWVLWVRRGTWQPAAESTNAYVDLLHRRAIAEVRKLVVLRRTLVVLLLGYGGFLAWTRHVTPWSAVVMAGLLVESLWMRRREQHRRRDAEDAAALARNVSQEEAGSKERTKQP